MGGGGQAGKWQQFENSATAGHGMAGGGVMARRRSEVGSRTETASDGGLFERGREGSQSLQCLR